MDQNTIIDSKSDGNYNHDNAITSSVLQAASDGYKVNRVLSIAICVLVYGIFQKQDENSDSNAKVGRESAFDQCSMNRA